VSGHTLPSLGSAAQVMAVRMVSAIARTIPTVASFGVIVFPSWFPGCRIFYWE